MIKMIKTIFYTFILALIILALGGAYFAYQEGEQSVSSIDLLRQSNQKVNEEKDEHGCSAASGYSWCDSKKKCLRAWEEGCKDTIYRIFDYLKNETAIEFSNIEQDKMKWNIQTNEGVKELGLDGFYMEAEELGDQQIKTIEIFLDGQGFEADEYNTAAGTAVSSVGYFNNGLSLGCIVASVFSDFVDPDDEKYVPATDKKNLKIACAVLEKPELKEVAAERQIRELLAAKYKKKVSQVKVEIDQQTAHHARGSVWFLPAEPFASGELSEGGIFLATDITGRWQIVFDGNGSISCTLVGQYNFPQNLISDCAE